MSDDEFLHAFMEGLLSPRQFHHRDHLRVAWLLVRQMDVASATRAMSAGIRRFAAAHDHAAMYHETLTQFWVRTLAHMARERPDIAEFDVLIETFPQALDTRLPHRHWRHDTLWSAVATATWVEPDLLPLPDSGASCRDEGRVATPPMSR